MTMNERYADSIAEALKRNTELDGMRIVKAFSGEAVGQPVDAPLVSVGLERADRYGFLLGYDNDMFGSEKIVVSVLSDEGQGGEYCTDAAEKVCRAVLGSDEDKLICSVSADKLMYDKQNFAYKVVMRFTLAEIGMCVREGSA